MPPDEEPSPRKVLKKQKRALPTLRQIVEMSIDYLRPEQIVL
jgi:hypothetical protein